MNLIAKITPGFSNSQGRLPKTRQSVAIERLEGRELFSTYTVTNLHDSGTGSLRQAIANANAHAGADVIDFKAGLTGTITLTSGELLISSSVAINGPGSSKLTINGDHKSRVFYLSDPNANVSISGLTIYNGLSAPGFGGGMENFSNLTLSHVVFSKNLAGSHATTGGVGGGGGGLMNYGKANISYCTFDSNQSLEYDLYEYGGAAIFNAGNLALTHSTISHNESLLSPTVTIPHSGEDAGAGGIYNGGTLLATDDTIAYNIAGGGSAGGMWNAGTATVVSCTVAHNSGGFVAGGILSIGTLKLGNSILALNTYIAFHGASPDMDASTGTFIDLGHNLFGLNPGGTLASSDLHGTFSTILNPDLGPLQFNGGPTKTTAITKSSPAYNHGSNSLDTTYGLSTDQRGDLRIENITADIGAYEAA